MNVFLPHITVATVIEKDNQFLCVEEFDANKHRLLNQPAGHVENGESLITAAVRETLEETAWQCTLTGVVNISRWQHPNSAETFFRITFAADPVKHFSEQALDKGIIQALWLTYDEILQRQPTHRSPMVQKSLDDYLSGTLYSLDIIRDL